MCDCVWDVTLLLFSLAVTILSITTDLFILSVGCYLPIFVIKIISVGLDHCPPSYPTIAGRVCIFLYIDEGPIQIVQTLVKRRLLVIKLYYNTYKKNCTRISALYIELEVLTFQLINILQQRAYKLLYLFCIYLIIKK